MAKWVRLDAKFDYPVPGKRAVVAFPAGYTAYMPDAMAKAAVEAGNPIVDRPKGAKVAKDGTVTYVRSN